MINKNRFQTGGLIPKGNQKPVKIHDGSFYVPEEVMKKFGLDLLKKLNSGDFDKK